MQEKFEALQAGFKTLKKYPSKNPAAVGAV